MKEKEKKGSSSKTINAFGVLMNGINGKRPKLSLMNTSSTSNGAANNTSSTGQSRFATCPICQKNIAIATVQFHIEQCLVADPETLPTDSNNIDDTKSINNSKPCSSNALQHLMNQSKLLSRPPLRQRFHLHSNLTVTWENLISDCNTETAENNDDMDKKQHSAMVQWSATTRLESSSSTTAKEQERNVELIVSSSIPSTSSSPRQHDNLSKLSIPILKSMIQKAIRRQLPIKAIKLAMELSVKSWGDLIRRLPIIMLEDAVLHPALPFIVWLMVADTKNYIANSDIMDYTMSIIYELASCNWRDDARHYEEATTNTNSLPSLYSDSSLCGLDIQNQTIIKSMLLRAKYGGMMCDVEMMHNYAQLWSRRFKSDSTNSSFYDYRHVVVQDVIDEGDNNNSSCISISIITTTTSKCGDWQQSLTDPHKSVVPWKCLPFKLHHSSREDYKRRGRSVVMIGSSSCLYMKDLCLEGLDYHCSHILDHLLEHHNDALLSLLHQQHLNIKIKKNDQELLRLWCQKSMWKYSSGVNMKRFLFQNNNNAEESSSNTILMSSLWNFMEPHVNQYARTFLSNRLAFP